MNNPVKAAPECPFQKRFPSQLQRDDLYFMSLAYNQAIDAWKENEVPIGAVVAYQGEAIAAAHNQVESTKDPTAHAEMLAITQAARHLKDWRLNETTLYVTKEPCPMCSGASMMSRLGRVVYAVPDPKMGGLGGLYDVNSYPTINHSLSVEIGTMREECLELLQAFFQLKREMSKGTI
ncbi:tRNA adenosine(34) deaminase TadA [Pelagicoccus sp. SDUM812003]|uniref:tRNA adenosine(34) deaminase TadA n=1 Tax=Pelagicoccus sp. SDUM812003 TaxID=3041267 RepID=UPI00281092ED|nr:tRNA adenosine(34) deaminase TadA [Pelagicoccus sp. SDUM812003]MDQ8204908.1 tRNA adenosine(34) deaminase TadA [Pelagicoccus sp. SDUM812003]